MRKRYAASLQRSCWPPPSRRRSFSPRTPPRSPPPSRSRPRHTHPAMRPPLRSRHRRRTAARHRSTPLASSPSTKAPRTTTPRSRTSPTRSLIQPDDDGRYQVERGQQITVVTAAPLPADYTRFYLQRQPLQVTVSPTSFQQLIPPVGTTYTFTVTTDDGGANLISFDLTAARPRPNPRPGQKPDSAMSWSRPTSWSRPSATTRSTSPAPQPPPAATHSSGRAASRPSAIGNFGYSAMGTAELRIHPTDASGTSRADFFDTVRVGASFDYRTSGLACGSASR